MSIEVSADWEHECSRAAEILDQSGPLSRLELLCSWALSSSADQRALAAAALLGRPHQLGAETILGYLAGDDVASVRRVVARVVSALDRDDPAAFEALRRRLAADADPDVRAIALGGL